jgi:hypothetical protein
MTLSIRPALLLLSVLAVVACRKAAPPAPPPEPVAVTPIDVCASARERIAAQPDMIVDRLPVPIAMKPAPLQRVPARALRKDGSAEVNVDVVVDTLGRPDMRTFKVVSTSHAWLAQNVRTVMPKWAFSPAEIGGCKVPRVYHFSATQPPRAARTARPAAARPTGD